MRKAGELVYTGEFLLFSHRTHAILPSYHHHLYSPRTSVLDQVGSVSRRLLRTHETRRTFATKQQHKGSTPLEVACSLNRAQAPAELEAVATPITSKVLACCGPILVHGRAKVQPIRIKSVHRALQLHACMSLSWPVFCQQNSDLSLLWVRLDCSECSLQESCA